jgi:hypothetical protein
VLLCREISFIFHREVPFLATVEIQPDRTEWLPYAEEVIGKSITIRIPLPSRPEPTILKLIRLLSLSGAVVASSVIKPFVHASLRDISQTISPLRSEAGGKSSPDLCGGRPAMIVPTAIRSNLAVILLTASGVKRPGQQLSGNLLLNVFC